MDIYSINVMIVACVAVAVFFIWMSFYPSNLNFLMERIATGNGFQGTAINEEKPNPIFKAFLPPAQKLAAKIGNKIPQKTLKDIEKRLYKAGNPLDMKPIEFYCMAPVGLIYGFVFGLIFGVATGVLPIALGGAVLGFVLPNQTLNGMIKERGQLCDMQMPDVLDLIAVCMDGGMTLTKSLEVICSKNQGLLVDEMRKVLSDRERGASLLDAFISLQKRVDSKRIEKVVQAVKISETLGTPISKQLKNLADTIRNDTFELVKQKAAKAAIFVIIPVLFFILPSMVIIVAGPLAINILAAS